MILASPNKSNISDLTLNLKIPTLAGEEQVEKCSFLRLTGVNQLPGLEIETDMVANVTNIFA